MSKISGTGVQTKTISVFAIDDEGLVLAGLKSQFRGIHDGIKVTGSAVSIQEALSEMKKTVFDIILLDLWIGKRDPVENIRLLKEIFPGKPVIVFTVEDYDEWRLTMFKEGAAAFLNKDASRCEIISMLNHVYRGESIMDTECKKNPVSRWAYLRKNYDFTSFQVKILFLLSEGFEEKQIAAELGISLSCVNKTLIGIRKTCRAKNNIHLIRKLLI